MGEVIAFGRTRAIRADRKKELSERHPMVQWLDSFINSPQCQRLLDKPAQQETKHDR